MTLLPDPPSFVVADSTFDLEIKYLRKIRFGHRMVTNKILLWELSDAAW